MREFKGSKGEWKQEHRVIDEEGMYMTEVFSGDTVICKMCWAGDRIGNTTYSRCKQNAKLIAAAPELLRMIIEMQENSNAKTPLERERFYKVEKLINKALGE